MKRTTIIMLLLLILSVEAFADTKIKAGLVTSTETITTTADGAVTSEKNTPQTSPYVGIQQQYRLENGVVIDAGAVLVGPTAPYLNVDFNVGYGLTEKLTVKAGVSVATLSKPVDYGAGFQLGLEYQFTDSMDLEIVHGSASSTKVSTLGNILINETVRRTSTSIGLNFTF